MRSLVPLLFLSWALGSVAAQAQVLGDAEQKVMNAIKEAKELNDLRAIEKLAQRNKTEMTNIFDAYEESLAYSDSLDLWGVYKEVGRALDTAGNSDFHATQMKIMEKMSLENRQKRYVHRNTYDGIRNALQSASKAKDVAAIETSANELLDLAKKFGEIGDPVFQGYSIGEVAATFQRHDRQVDAVRLYGEVEKILTAAGFSSWRFLGEIKASRQRLIAEGYDPNAKPGEQPTGPAGNTGTSWSKDPAGERYSDPVPLKLVMDDKITSKFVTPSSRNTDNTFRWDGFRVNGDKPIQFDSRFQPLGQPITVRRDGVKIYMDAGDGKEQEVKCIQKPNLVEMMREVKDIDGNASRLEYAWLAATGGEESLFGLSVNVGNSESAFTIRYHSGCYLKGRVLGNDILIFDDNSTGRFGDPIGVRDSTTLSGPSFVNNDAMMFGRDKTAGPWTEYIEVDGEFYRLKLDPDTYSVRTRKLSVDTGTVLLRFDGKIQPSVLTIEETREFKGAFFALDPKKPTRVPVGTYQISHGIIRKGKGKQEKTCEIFPGESRPFQVKKDEEYVLELGAPFSFDFETERTPDGGVKVIGKSVVIKGKADELYIRFFDDPPIPDKVSARPKGSSGGGRPEKMDRATFDDFQKDTTAAYSPLDLILPGKSDTEYEVQMSLKKYFLLQGQIKSDWK